MQRLPTTRSTVDSSCTGRPESKLLSPRCKIRIARQEKRKFFSQHILRHADSFVLSDGSPAAHYHISSQTKTEATGDSALDYCYKQGVEALCCLAILPRRSPSTFLGEHLKLTAARDYCRGLQTCCSVDRVYPSGLLPTPLGLVGTLEGSMYFL